MDYPFAIVPKSGWTLTSVTLDVEGDGQNGYINHLNKFPGTYNPDGNDSVEGAKVSLKTADCPEEPTPAEQAEQN